MVDNGVSHWIFMLLVPKMQCCVIWVFKKCLQKLDKTEKQTATMYKRLNDVLVMCGSIVKCVTVIKRLFFVCFVFLNGIRE